MSHFSIKLGFILDSSHFFIILNITFFSGLFCFQLFTKNLVHFNPFKRCFYTKPRSVINEKHSLFYAAEFDSLPWEVLHLCEHLLKETDVNIYGGPCGRWALSSSQCLDLIKL